jgi:TrmH family RNA methyltransferase
MSETLTSSHNPRAKKLIRLRERSVRQETKRFLIEGKKELSMALLSGQPLEELYFCSDFLDKEQEELLKKFQKQGVALFACNRALFQKVTYRENPDGLLAVAPMQPHRLEDLKLPPHPLLLVAEGIEKPGNLGAILRSCDAVGVDGVIICGGTDLYNPNAIRASIGTLFTLPLAEASSRETMTWLQKNKIVSLAATPSANKLFTDFNMKHPLALVVGTEHEGLSSLWLKGATTGIRIPMQGKADSLNVAMSATLLLYEAYRQRSAITYK